MKSSWKKQRLATKKKQIKQIEYKKSVFWTNVKYLDTK